MKNSLKYRFLEFAKTHHLFSGIDRILVAVSGGVDSVVLFHLLLAWQKYFNLELGVVHFNHQLRAQASDQDEAFVKALCKKHDLPCYTQRGDIAQFARVHRYSIEEAARILRETFFRECRIQEGYQVVATAHHLNDQIETILMRLITGSGLEGLAGIHLQREGIVRPLLFANRQDILEYARHQQIVYREDPSNQNIRFLRNRIRHKLIPFLQKEFKMLNPDAFLHLGLIVQEWLSIENMNSPFLTHLSETKQQNKIHLDLTTYKNYFSGIKIKILETVLRTLLNKSVKLSYNKFQSFSKWFNKQENSRKFLLHPGICVSKEKGNLIFERLNDQRQNTRVYAYISPGEPYRNLKLGIVLSLSWIPTTEICFSDAKDVEFLDARQLEFPLVLRTWEAGDRFQPLGVSYQRKISDFLNDENGLILAKKQIPVLENNDEIIYVAGCRINENYKITNKTKKALKLEIKYEDS